MKNEEPLMVRFNCEVSPLEWQALR